MSDAVKEVSRSERADRAITTASGWAALALGIFSIHRAIAVGSPIWGEWWARASLIMAAGLGINAVAAFQLHVALKLDWPAVMGVFVWEGLVITILGALLTAWPVSWA